MASSKSSQTTRNIVIAFLALWSVISLIIIVVWATSPDMKSATQCRAEMQDLTNKYKDSKITWQKDKEALEEMVEAGRENQTTLRREIDVLMGRLNDTNTTLSACQEENVILNGNVTALENEVEAHVKTEANLTAEVELQKERVERLEQNMTQIFHQQESCKALLTAAKSQQQAAESQTNACESSKQYVQKQLQKCKSQGSTALEPQKTGNGVSGHHTNTLATFLCIMSLHFLSS
ncbi:uncharacterized protein si:ch211-1a19.3 [Megalops cyprinoides]|uniref:uncharacterized protein si:ch211-1a19.3 n=1 Tax=Megalops cyprinoides TaxID=118141 RepID=UPI001863AAFC|nr:uncharacterized protein si:ch211-1a19.3 [Megalops cyprinoides]